MSRLSRYPGAQPFSDQQFGQFFGRKEDTSRLHRLVRHEPLVVLYARSGLGKSSLLNAGLVPALRLEGQVQPLSVRFGAWTEGKMETPLETVVQAIRQHAAIEGWAFASLAGAQNSLWEAAKSAQGLGKMPYLLIFDQFEELFTYPAEAIQAFAASLAEALFTRIPQRYRSALEHQLETNPDGLDEDMVQRLEAPLGLRVVMAIRSDRLSLLDSLTGQLPTLLKHLFELPPLDEASARQAIEEPAKSREEEFETPPFTYSPEALQFLLNHLTKSGRQGIESTQLQILCQSVERKVNRADQVVRMEDIGDPDIIIGRYYEEQLATLGGEAEQLAARKLIEEGLVFEEEERRLSLYEGQIYRTYGITQRQLQVLVDVHLLRSEPSLQGGYTYELSHDTLVAPVLEARRKRRQAEQAAREAEQRRIREAEIASAKAEAARERRRRVFSNVLAAVAVVGLVVSVWQSGKAIEAKELAENAKEEAVNARETAEASLRAPEREKATALVRDGNAFLQNGEPAFALGKYTEAWELDSSFQELPGLMDSLRTVLSLPLR